MPDATYTHGHHASVLASHRWRTARNSASHLVPHLRPGHCVLDVGCGPGTITADLAALVAPGDVVGVDSAAAVVTAAAAEHDRSPNLRFEVGDVLRLPFEDDRFHVVHAHQVLQHVADPVAALREMRRVCRSEGIVAIRDADYSSFAWAPLDPRLDRWLELYRSLARANGGEPDAGRFLHRWALDAGCTRVRSSASIWCFSTPEDREWWSTTWAARLSDSALAHQLLASGAVDRVEVGELSSAFLDWGRDPAAWFAVPHGEVLASP